MTDIEIQTFIETMEELGDQWTPEQVKEVYNDYTYEAAIAERRREWEMYQKNLATLIH